MDRRRLRIAIDVTVEGEADDESVADRVFTLIGNDPDHLIDEIWTVDDYTVQRLDG